MKRFLTLFLPLFIILAGTFNMINAENNTKKLLIVTGAKGFDHKELFEVFSSFKDVQYDTTTKPGIFKLFREEKIKEYDAILFYDSYQPITEEQKQSFLNIFKSGVGCIFLHHSIVSHQEWEEYENIIGGRYYHKPFKEDGKGYGPSTYKHDQDFRVIIIDKEHPVTRGVNDFQIHDEIYLNYKVHKDVTPLLTSDNCETNKYIGWTKKYDNSKIVVIQLGHDKAAYISEGFRQILRNAIFWIAK